MLTDFDTIIYKTKRCFLFLFQCKGRIFPDETFALCLDKKGQLQEIENLKAEAYSKNLDHLGNLNC